MKKISSVLAGKTFTPIRNMARAMEALTTATEDALRACDIPPAQCRVHSYADAILRLYADTAAIAYRVQQILPTLRRILNNAGYKVTVIEVFHTRPPEDVNRRRRRQSEKI